MNATDNKNSNTIDSKKERNNTFMRESFVDYMSQINKNIFDIN